MTVPVLFLSEAGLPDWIWNEVRTGLGAHPSVVVERPVGAATLADHAAAVLDQAPRQVPPPVAVQHLLVVVVQVPVALTALASVTDSGTCR